MPDNHPKMNGNNPASYSVMKSLIDLGLAKYFGIIYGVYSMVGLSPGPYKWTNMCIGAGMYAAGEYFQQRARQHQISSSFSKLEQQVLEIVRKTPIP